MAAHAEAFTESGFVPLLPDGVRWGDISDAEDEEPAAAADGDEEFENDPKRLMARQQQIDFGKNTLGYERYLQAVPKHKRKLRGKEHDPPTPDITRKMSKRTWDGIVKAWRRHLHKFDNVEAPAPAAAAGDSSAAAAAADMQVDAAPAMPDAPRAAAANSNRWRANKRRAAKPQHSSSSSRMRQDDTASQQRQEQAAPVATQHSPTQQQQQQQADERDRQQHRHGGRREEVQRSGGGSSGARRIAHHSSSHKSSRDDTGAARGESGADHEREYGQPPRYNSYNSHNSRSAARSSQEHRHGSGSGRPSAGPRGSSSSRGGSSYKGGSQQQQQQQREMQDGLPAEGAGRRPPDCAAAAGDLAAGSSRQLTPAKRGSSSQADVDSRPSKHC